MKYLIAGLVGAAVVVLVVVLTRPAGKDQNGVTSRTASFRMPIEVVFGLKIPGVVVVGVVEEGQVRPGDHLRLDGRSGTIEVRVESLEANHQPLRSAKAGDRIGIMLVGVNKEQVTPGDMLVDGVKR